MTTDTPAGLFYRRNAVQIASENCRTPQDVGLGCGFCRCVSDVLKPIILYTEQSSNTTFSFFFFMYRNFISSFIRNLHFFWVRVAAGEVCGIFILV